MRNTSAVGQDNNASRYSYVSVEKQTGNQSVSEYFPDSTDKLVSEILKARVERLNKQKQDDQNEKASGSQEVVNIPSYQTREISQIMPISKVRSGLVNPTELHKETVIENPISSLAKQEKTEEKQKVNEAEMQQKESSLEVNKINIVLEESRSTSKMQQYHSNQSSKIQFQQEKDEIEKKNEQVEAVTPKKQQQINQVEMQADKFQEPKVDAQANQESQANEKEVKVEASRSVSQSVSDYIDIGYGRSINPKSQIKLKDDGSSNNENIQNIENIEFYKNDGEMNAVQQSKIQPKQSEIYVQKDIKQNKDYYEFGLDQKQNQTDRQVVQALNQRLNQINQSQEAEINQVVSKRISSQRNPSSANFQTLITAQPDKKKEEQVNFVSEFETEYSDDLRDYNILDHHFQSNITLLQKQTNELLTLYEAMIMEEQCKQLRKRVKDAQLQNRKYKIMLRNASYSKRFNFHSPIQKNNNQPLEFYKKFKVSQNYAVQYNEILQKIAEEKKSQAVLQEQYKIIDDFQQLMRNKKVSSYPSLPFDLQYDKDLGKYRTTKIGFYSQNSQKQKSQSSKKSKKYEFSKSKRTLKLQEEEIKYYDLLCYKKDICKESILEFQVFNLGRIKKLKDQNKIISKEIYFAKQKIEQINKQLQKRIPRVSSQNEIVFSEYFIRSKKSFSRSPHISSTTQLYGINSPNKSNQNFTSERKIVSKGRLSLTNCEDKNTLSSKKQLTKKIQVAKPSIIDELNDDYGLSSIRDVIKQAHQIPTFGKNDEQKKIFMQIKTEKKKKRVQSPLTKKINYIKMNKETLAKNELNIESKKSNKKLMNEQFSPIKKIKKSFSISADQSKSSNM